MLLSLISISLMSNCLSPAFSAETEIILDFGTKPTIDGYIDRAVDEWNDAIKSNFFLYQNLSDPKNGLETDLWVIQHELFLYIAISFELVEHHLNEYVGILTAEEESLNPLDYEDAKIIQFTNLTEGTFEYRDYYINNSRFFADSELQGAGAAQLDIDGERITYEFKIPVESSEGGNEDLRIEAGIYSPFMIIFGESQNYNEEIILMNLVSLFIQFYAYNPTISAEQILLITLAAVIFSLIGTFYGYYIYQIIKLKDKIKKIRS
jgi:hypothetical protein